MARRSFTVLSAVPGSTTFRPIVEGFCKRCKAAGTDGIVTALSDSALPMCHQMADEDVVEVLPFGELVRRSLVLCGEEALPIAQGGHIEAAIAKACVALPETSPFARTARFAGLHRALMATMKELEEWDIDRDELRRLVPLASDRLAAKLTSLIEIDAAVEEVLAKLRVQTHRYHLRACLDAIPELDSAFPPLLIHVGAEDSPLKLQWIRWAARHGTSTTVVVERHAADAHLFAGAARAQARLHGEASPTGDGNRLTRNLFAAADEGGPAIEVQIVSAVDPLAEAEWALRDCLAASPNPSTIYVRNLELYAPLLESAGRRLGIPVSIARRAPLLTNSFARLTLAAIDFCASHDVRTLEPILQSSYLGLPGEKQEEIRSALRDAYRGRASQWDTLKTWTDAHREEVPWLANLLDWRGRAQANFTLREWKLLLAELIRPSDNFPWSTRVMDDKGMSERDRRARNQLERLLADHITVEELFDRPTYPLPAVASLCRRLWQDAEVSIPPADTGIQVADDPYRLSDAPTLRVMGMLEGVFPRRRSEEPILTDAERAEIDRLRPDAPRLLNSHDRAEAERDAFYRVCAVAKSRIVFSYPLADDSRDNIPAFYLKEVERAAKGFVTRRDFPRTLFAPFADDCLAEADRALREALEAPREFPAPVALQTEAARATVRPPEGARFHPRELRTALQCPFQYAVRYRMRPHVRRSGERWHTLSNLPKSAGLLSKTDPDEAERVLTQALDAELDMLYSEVPAWEMQLLRAGGQRVIREWLRREFLSREIWPKSSLATNVPFGSESLRSDMPGGVQLEGVLAGVSRHKSYTVAHLYESGVRDPKDLSDTEALYYGLHFLALHDREREGAIEIESMRGKRELLVLSRSGGDVAGQVENNLSVVDLATSDDPLQSKKQFYDRVKGLLKKAVEGILSGRIDPINGDHCDFCDYGELCRRARSYGEDESPFGNDEALDDL